MLPAALRAVRYPHGGAFRGRFCRQWQLRFVTKYPPATPPPPPSADPWSRSRVDRVFLKFTLFGSTIGALATTGYATYEYTLDKLDDKVKSIRALANYNAGGDDPSNMVKIQAFICSKAMKASASVIELYIHTRRFLEELVRASPEFAPDVDVYTLVLDLCETLIYSDWERDRGWRTLKRPGVDVFLEELSRHFEIVVYSDMSVTKVKEIVKALDRKCQCIPSRLGRGATKYQNGENYTDLSKLNRDLPRVLYVSAHAKENCSPPENNVLIKPWKGDVDDMTLLDLLPFLCFVGTRRPLLDIRGVIATYDGVEFRDG